MRAMIRRRLHLHPGDLVVMGLVLLAAAAAAILIPSALAGSSSGSPLQVEVRSLEPGGGAEVVTLVDLPAETSLELPGGMLLVVSGYTARVVESDCPQKICTRATLTRVGDRTLCVPNRIVVEMRGDPSDRPYDMIVR